MGIVSEDWPAQRRARKSVAAIQRAALTFVKQGLAVSSATKEKNKARDEIKAFTLPDPDNEKLNPNGVRIDENGHRYYDFEQIIEIDGNKYKGLCNQRNVSVDVDMDKVREFFEGTHEGDPDPTLSQDEQVRRNTLKQRVYKPVTTWMWDFEELYRMNQQGLLSDEELDSLTTTNITWSLNAKKA